MKKLYKFYLYLFIFLVLSISIFILFSDKFKISFSKNVAISKSQEYKHPGKCITCEKQFGKNTRWMGLSNKCYDCEKDLVNRSGGDLSAAYNGVKSKCFDC